MPHAVETVTVGGARIRLFGGGAGRPVMFLHGTVGITANGEPIPDTFRMADDENLHRYYADPEGCRPTPFRPGRRLPARKPSDRVEQPNQNGRRR